MQCLQIVGPPGTGKTQTLMGILADLTKETRPGEILFCSFTRAAVHEAINRMRDQLGISQYDLPFFGTIHSICFRHLGLTRQNVINRRQRKEFCEFHNIALTDLGSADVDTALEEPWEPVGTEEGDVFFAWYDWARNCCLGLKEAAAAYDPPDTVPWNREKMVTLAAEFERYKQECNIYDFPQMLAVTLAEGWVPPVKVLVLDEAQDLSPLQQGLFLHWAQGKVAYIGGDEDQAIYTFQGADPSWLLALPGERRFLEQSHRVPQRIGFFAQRLIQKNRRRYEKTWAPANVEGVLALDTELAPLVTKMAETEERWFCLARNNMYLQAFSEHLLGAGVPYVNLRGASPLRKLPSSVLAAIRLADGQRITADELRLLSSDIAASPWFVRGAKTEIERRAKEYPEEVYALNSLYSMGATSGLVNKLSRMETCLQPIRRLEGNKDYYLRVYRRYGLTGLTNKPRVVLSSIHGVKGAEADNVVLLPNMTRRTEDSYGMDPEPERRVWYVAATRAKKRLFILEPTQRRFFEDW